jgi:putative nucleotidyltransferase with HDIG domain
MFGPLKKSARLLGWDGRWRSSRSEEPLLLRLRHKPALLRLGVVFGTALLATLLAFRFGGVFCYRVGQTPLNEVRARVYFEVVNQARTDQAREEAISKLPPPWQNEQTWAAVPPVMDRYPPGTLLAPRGQPITAAQHALMQEEMKAYLKQRSNTEHGRRLGSLFLVFSLLAGLVILYVIRFQHSLAESLPKVLGVCALVLLTLTLALILNRPPWHAVLVPLTVTALILTIAYNPQFALLMSLSLTLAVTLTLGNWLGDLLVAMGGQATAILLLRGVRSRTRLVHVGLTAGLAYAAMTLAINLHYGQAWHMMAFDALRGLVWGTLAGFLVGGLLPLVERCFSVVTDVRLLELGDGSHPLLQELVRRAPGTYTHSMTVATLAEPAAEAIGASPLLARVASYFHDIGKMLKPHYFIENQIGENRHDSLEPTLSTLIIIGHVKDGTALAEQYGLPRPIIEIIEQHHGTTLVEYFYREALKQQESQGFAPTLADGEPNPLEATFRYPGPKPQNREAGVVMLADAVESASRALSQPTPGSLKKLVRGLLMKRLLDGQFEESGLTLTELRLIEESLVKGLTALYHSRIKYPEQERKAS